MISGGGNHDLGGVEIFDGDGRISFLEKPMQQWELEIHSLLVLLASRQSTLITTDELRRGIESLEPNSYRTWGYYDRWAASIAIILLERGVITQTKLDQYISGEEASRPVEDIFPTFKAGDKVVIKAETTRLRWRRPHLRCPGYVFGTKGVITNLVGSFDDPFLLAFRGKGPKQPLYQVFIPLSELWARQDNKQAFHPDIAGGDESLDGVELEVYQDWLDADTAADSDDHHTHEHNHHEHCADHDDDHHHHDDDHHSSATAAVVATKIEHEHNHDHGPVEAPSPEITPGEVIGRALLSLLADEDIAPPLQLAQIAERLQQAGVDMKGATLVAHAWKTPVFKAALLHNAQDAAASIGISTSNPNAPTVLKVLANSDTEHHLVVCTLCSCYPTALLGFSPAWYKSRNYRARAVREPRKVLAEFGVELSPAVRVIVHDSTADCRYLVLPQPPRSLTTGMIEAMTVEDLKKLVSRNSMIGVELL